MVTVNKIGSLSINFKNKQSEQINKNIETNYLTSFKGSIVDKPISQAISAKFQATQNIHKSKFMSFGAKGLPPNSRFRGNNLLVRTNNCINEGEKQSFADYVNSHEFSILPVNEVTYHDMYSYPVGERFLCNLEIYKNGEWAYDVDAPWGEMDRRKEEDFIEIEKNESLDFAIDKYKNDQCIRPAIIEKLICAGRIDEAIQNYYDTDTIVSTLAKIGKLDEAIKRFGYPSVVCYELLNLGRVNEAIEHISYNNNMCKELLNTGKLDEAIKRFGNTSVVYDELFHLGRIREAIEHDDAKHRSALSKLVKIGKYKEAIQNGYKPSKEEQMVFDFIDKNFDFEKYAKSKKNKLKDIKRANQQINSEREFIANTIEDMQKERDKLIDTRFRVASKTAELETKKDNVKNEIQRKLIDLIELDQKKKFVEEFPNCLMLMGEHTPLMQDLIDWTGENADCNYVKVPYIINNDDHQEAIGDALEKAEEIYKKSGKRSLIYVNGLEKLINPKLNTFGNIECMKNLMNKAGTKFHSTLIFTAKDPSKLDDGATGENRVTIIDVPITFEDTRII